MIIIPKRKWAFPLAYERSYNKTLRAYVARLTEAAEAETDRMQALMERRGVKFDSYEDDLDALLAKIGANVDRKVAEAALQRKVQQMYRSVNAFNEDEFKAIIHDAVGAEDFFINEKWQSLARSVWVQENLNYIRSIRRQFLDRIRQDMGEMILNAQGKQLRAAELSEMIQDIAHNARNRADLIARDQIGKLNGRLTQLRQQSAGIGRYEWSTSRDERVRASHAEREGKIFSWDNPPPDGHPGMPIRCRCVAIPVIDTETLGAHISGNGIIETEDNLHPREVAGVRRGKPMTEEEADSGNVNPHYTAGKYDGYSVNCQSCVVTYEARMRGYNVETLPNSERVTSASYALSRNTRLAWIDPKTGEIPQFIPHPDATRIGVKTYLKWLDEAVETGKRYTIQVRWKGGNGAGHIVIMHRNADGHLELYDPQTGKKFTKDYIEDTRKGERQEAKDGWTYCGKSNMLEGWFSRVQFKIRGWWVGPELLRVDDKEFNLDVVDKIMMKFGGGR